MPINDPEKVSISPNAIKIEWWISANGGQMKPAVSIAHPKVHNANAVNSCKRFIIFSGILFPTDLTDYHR